MTEEKILARIRKMLAMANDSACNEGERDNALRMAYNLLAKYELDMSDVEAHKRDADDPRMHAMNTGWNPAYAKQIRHCVSKLFNVKYYFGAKINATRGEHNYVGRESAVTTAMYMSDWIIQSMLREADKRYGHRLSREGRAFCVGTADTLSIRVKQLVAAKQTEFSGTGSSLVLVDLYQSEMEANSAFLAAMGTSLKKSTPRKSSVDANAYSSGREYGNTIGLNTQVGNKKGTLAIK